MLAVSRFLQVLYSLLKPQKWGPKLQDSSESRKRLSKKDEWSKKMGKGYSVWQAYLAQSNFIRKLQAYQRYIRSYNFQDLDSCGV
jgi:hypothetical protein